MARYSLDSLFDSAFGARRSQPLRRDEELDGTTAADLIEGEQGNDSIEAGAGADTVDGGEGADEIEAGGGDDVVDGGEGADLIDGEK